MSLQYTDDDIKVSDINDNLFSGFIANFDFNKYLADNYFKAKYYSRQLLFNYENCVNAIAILSTVNKYKYQTMYKTTILDYNPIYNYDNTETITDTTTVNQDVKNGGSDTTDLTHNTTNTTKGDNTQTYNTTDTTTTDNTLTHNTTNSNTKDMTTTYNTTNSVNSTTQSENNGNTVNSVTTFDNVDNFNNNDKNISKDTINGTNTTADVKTGNDKTGGTDNTKITGDDKTHIATTFAKTGNDKTNNTTTNTMTGGDNNVVNYGKTENLKNTTVFEHTLKKQGNIGVTTSQQMLQSERDIALFSLYDIIITDVAKLITNETY